MRMNGVLAFKFQEYTQSSGDLAIYLTSTIETSYVLKSALRVQH